MSEFDFVKIDNLDTAIDYLDRYKNVKLISGGTDLVVNIRKKTKESNIDYILDISNLNKLNFIIHDEEFINIGPCVTHSMLINEPIIKDKFPILVEAAKNIGSTLIRNRGTIGGNICNAATCADLVPPLIALRAEVTLKSKNDERILPVEDFIDGPFKTVLKNNEILTNIRIPLLGSDYYWCYQKIGRRKSLSISRLSLALVAQIENNHIKAIKIVPGAATPYPKAFHNTEKKLVGKSICKLNTEEIGRLASQEMILITGERWSTPYKKPTIATLVRRALEKVIEEVEDNEQG